MKRMMRLGLHHPPNRTHHHSLAPLYRPQIHFENTNSIRREMGSVDPHDLDGPDGPDKPGRTGLRTELRTGTARTDELFKNEIP